MLGARAGVVILSIVCSCCTRQREKHRPVLSFLRPFHSFQQQPGEQHRGGADSQQQREHAQLSDLLGVFSFSSEVQHSGGHSHVFSFARSLIIRPVTWQGNTPCTPSKTRQNQNGRRSGEKKNLSAARHGPLAKPVQGMQGPCSASSGLLRGFPEVCATPTPFLGVRAK